jgi:hypothetical protein
MSDLNWEILLIYIDDVLVYSRSFEEHLEHLRIVFDRLRTTGLKLNVDKCVFSRKQVKYLGYLVSEKGVHPDKDKVVSITNFPCPQSVSELRRFIGMASYYRRFINRFADIAEPLHSLTQKNVSYTWTSACQEAFESLKDRLSSAPILVYPCFQDEFVVETDASDIGLGAILCQDGHVIEYGSRALTKAEKNYSATEKECLGVVWALEKFGMYLEGRHFTVITDHKPLTYLRQLKEPKGKLARWRISLDSYDFTIHHRPGELMTVTDALSRAPQVNAVTLTGMWSKEELIRLQHSDKDVNAMCSWVRTRRMTTNISNHVRSFLTKEGKNLGLQDGLLVLNSVKGLDQRVKLTVVPSSEGERVLTALHDDMGHFGSAKTKAAVGSRFFWFAWKKDVHMWCKSCRECLQRKTPTVPDRPPEGELPVPNRPLQWWHMDFAGPLPKTARGNQYIFSLTDPVSKWVEAFAVADQSAKTTAEVIYNEIVCRYGVPDGLHSDQGRNFEANLMKELCHRLGIRRTRSSPYNPRCNGQVERMNRTTAERLAMLIEAGDQTDWDEKLPTALSAIRTVESSATRETPYYLLFGYESRNKSDFLATDKRQSGGKGAVEDMSKRLDCLKRLHETVRERILAEQRSRHRNQKSRVRFTPFAIGEKTWVFNPTRKKGLAKKLVRERWKGPYIVQKRLGETTYQLHPESSRGKSIVVNHRRMKRHCERPAHLSQWYTCSSTDTEDETYTEAEMIGREMYSEDGNAMSSSEEEHLQCDNNQPPERLTCRARRAPRWHQDYCMSEDSD